MISALHEQHRHAPEDPSVGMDPPPAESTAPQRSRWRRVMFCIVNLWLLIHLTAIITAPATVGPSSQTSRTVWEAVAPYLQGLYLNHGFHYFAPQPGSSNLVSWTVNRKDGTAVSGRFPKDRKSVV